MTKNIILFENNGLYSDIIPLNAGYEKCQPGYDVGPYARDKYSFHYIISGKGVFASRGKSYNVSSGQIFCFCKGERVSYRADDNEPWEYFWVGFDGAAAQRLNTLENQVVDYALPTFTRLCSILDNENCNKRDAVISAIFEVLSNILNDYDTSKRDYIADVKRCIRNHYSDGITVEDIATSVGLNRHYMTDIFHGATGETVIECLSRVRLENAHHLLESGYSVSETAFMVGYSDQFHFSRMFKRKFGCSPSDVKKQIKNG